MHYKNSYTKPTRASDEDEVEEIKFPFAEIDRKPYKQYDQTYSVQHTHYYISKSVGEPDAYIDMIHRISTAGPQDIIYLHLNTPGGQMDTGVQLINAMQNSDAKIVTILESTAYSLGTLIFLAGDEMVVNEHCMMMFHNFNGGLIGKGNELVSELEATVKWFASLAEDIYIPFLSQDEFNRIIRGEDMWMQTPEIKRRLENMVKLMNDQADAEVAELEQLAAELERAEAKAQKQKVAAKKLPAAKKTAPKKPRKPD